MQQKQRYSFNQGSRIGAHSITSPSLNHRAAEESQQTNERNDRMPTITSYARDKVDNYFTTRNIPLGYHVNIENSLVQIPHSWQLHCQLSIRTSSF